MTGVCPVCRETYTVPSRRGSKVGNHSCPTCRVPLQGRNAGKKRHKYLDVLRGGLFVYADGDDAYMRLTQPMVLAPWEPWEGTPWITEPTGYDQRIIGRCEGKVFGPGVVVARQCVDDLSGPPQTRWPRLIPIPEGLYDPATLVVSNGPVKQVKCRACGDLVTEPAPRPDEPWKPVREGRYHRRRWQAFALGPHPAGSPACPRCYPAVWPQAVQNSDREDMM